MKTVLSLVVTATALLSTHAAMVDPEAEGYSFCYQMTNAGTHGESLSNYKETSKAYCKRDCSDPAKDMICFYVVAEDGLFLADNEAWFKDYSYSNSDAPGDITFISDNGNTVAWQGCFEIQGDGSSIEIHANWGEIGGSAGSTSSTGKRQGKATSTRSIDYGTCDGGDGGGGTPPTAGEDPPTGGIPPGPCGEEYTCIPEGTACLGLEDECCDGYECLGYNFYKSCQVIPSCLPEWYACEPGGITCCKGMVRGDDTVNLVCAETHSGLTECQEEGIDTRNTELPPRPTPAPVPINLNTTRDLNQAVEYETGCLWGDPHIDTPDGLAYDCMGNGEFVVLKSTVTRRQVQGRFLQLENRRMTATQGVVIQDEGDTPKVQITMPMVDEGASHPLGNNGCKVQVFVDDKQVDLYNFIHPEVSLTVRHNNDIIVHYMRSEFQAEVKMGYWNGCHFTHCYKIPKTDAGKMVGILGDMDGNPNNDWMDRDGNEVDFDPTKVRWNFFGPEGGYDYCTDHWCLRKPEESMFVYNQVGFLFGNFQRCDLPADTWVTDDLIAGATDEIMDACNGNMACISDAVTGDLESALASMRLRATYLAETCNNEGGECEMANCCGGLTCMDEGSAGKICVSAIPDDFCMPSFGDCSDYPCCEGATCETNLNGYPRCVVHPTCKAMNYRCAEDSECCDDLHCIGEKYEKVCRPIDTLANGAVCIPEGTACYDVKPCCDGSVCLRDTDGTDRCVEDKCREKEEDCANDQGCCAGLTCQKWCDRMLCLDPPTCIGNLGECEVGGIECCNDNFICGEVKAGPEMGTMKCIHPNSAARRQLAAEKAGEA